jgi:hypothetical protein
VEDQQRGACRLRRKMQVFAWTTDMNARQTIVTALTTKSSVEARKNARSEAISR